VLYAGWHNDDIASGVFFGAFVSCTLAIAFKNYNHFFGLMKVPRNRYAWADDVLMNIRLRTKLFVRDEITNPSSWTARNLAQNSTENWHAHSPLIFDRSPPTRSPVLPPLHYPRHSQTEARPRNDDHVSGASLLGGLGAYWGSFEQVRLVNDVDEFRKQAEQAREMAERALSQEEKAFWLRMAEDWLRLAQAADQGEKGQAGQNSR